MEKKDLAIIILALLLAASGVGNIILGVEPVFIPPVSLKNWHRDAHAEAARPLVLDPVDSWDSVSNNMIRHVCDNLWYYDLYSGPDFQLEMRLATKYTWNMDMDELTVILRKNVYFHDGSYFNATAVKFTFDRILYFTNITGELNSETAHIASPSSLFYDMSGKSILNKTVINSDYNITFVLNNPNGVFIPLLSYDACAILHPATSPTTRYLEFGKDILVGTGPFEYVHYIAGEELKFKRFDLYWGPTTFWDEIIWVFYPDDLTANNAMLGKEIDYLGGCIPSLIPTFQADPEITFVNMNTSTTYQYLGMNNKKINNKNIRKAIAYAYNYSYYIEVVLYGFAIRAHQFLPPGFPYYNESFRAPEYNTAIARQAMINAFPNETLGLTAQLYGENGTNDAAWLALSLVSYDILEIEGSILSQEMNTVLAIDLDRIGIDISADLMDFHTLLDVMVNDKDRLNLWFAGWKPDYLDPFNMVEPLLNNISISNTIQLQDAQIMQWLKDYEETNPDNITKRADLLWKIQNRAINDLYVELPLCYPWIYYVHHKSLGNVCYNNMGSYWVRDSYYIPGVSTI